MIKNLKLNSSISAVDRAKEFKEDTYENEGVLFCKFCQHSIEHVRVHTINMHVKLAKHEEKKKKSNEKIKKDNAILQTSIEGATSKTETSSNIRSEFNKDLLQTLVVSNIPTEKVPLIHPFLLKHCTQSGSCPGAADGLHYYTTGIYEKHRFSIKVALSAKPLALIVYETTDASSRSVLISLL